MDKEQLKAIKSLERAFKKCKEARINFYGMDESLHAISKEKADESPQERKNLSCDGDRLHKCLNIDGIIVNTYGAYRNSGGF